MLNNIIGREVKIVRINNQRYNEDKELMFHSDELISKCINKVFEIADYDSSDNMTAVYIGGEMVWLYRNEYQILTRNLFIED